MKRFVIPGLLSLVLFQTGLLVGRSLAPTALADEPDTPPEVEPFYDPPRLYCRPFRVPLEGAPAAIETNDATTEIGQWLQKEEASYELFSVDFEIGQKATGYPEGWAYVCLSPRAG